MSDDGTTSKKYCNAAGTPTDHCQIYDNANKCAQCETRYFINSSSAVCYTSPDPRCIDIDPTSGNCTRCEKGFVLLNTASLKKCVRNDILLGT